MINLLQLTKRQTLILSAVTVTIGLALIVAMGVFVAAQSNSAQQAFGTLPKPTTPPITSVKDQRVKETETTASGDTKTTDDTQTVTTYEVPQTQPNKPAPTKTQDAPKPRQETPEANPVGNTVKDTVKGVTDTVRGVTYTLKDVIPGDPMSYVGTYGQCPFYEYAGAKGCWPPSNITCNSDWSICKLKDPAN